ncbi:MAG TPA: ATP-binding protein, partial [Bryobacteraceae bacterium]|nr:ATP-binding protein [Bryobacteraceae bacterium]
MTFSRLSLLWKILIPISLVMTSVFAITGWLVERSVVSTTYASVEQEAKASFQAYESLWKARADRLAAVSAILSTMSDVRAAFGTGDQATIRDTAGELWSKVSRENAFFLVSDAQGRVLASLGTPASFVPNDDLPVVRAARMHFPVQASGFVQKGDEMFQVVVTPVYVQAAGGPALLDVLVAGYKVDDSVAQSLKNSTGGSEYIFASRQYVITSTLGAEATASITPELLKNPGAPQISNYLALSQPLPDVGGAPVGQLYILRSFVAARDRLAALRREIVALWLLALIAGLGVTYLVARKIMHPVAELDRAAAEIAKQNYDYKVNVHSQDELGRLAETFQSMCESIRQARQELIRQERIATIGQLSTSIVHDLRNPLAAIYAGAEMLVDSNLPEEQTRRLAKNIYRASRGIQDMLQQLLNVVRGKSDASEMCSLREVISAAWDTVAPAADTRQVELVAEVPDELACPMERARMERVFSNLFENAIDAIGSGGRVAIRSIVDGESILVWVEDNGPGISPAVRGRLFQPFVTAGKKNGLGLGLALSRQTLLDHGGDMWADVNGPGARFVLRLPKGAMVASAPR